MPAPPRQPRTTSRRLAPDQAESALVGHYARWVRLAYLVLPADLGKHRRVLIAHGLVQRALPRVRSPKPAARVPAQRSPAAAAAGTAVLRERVVRAVLAHEEPRGWPERLLSPGAFRPLLPRVWGLRLFPHPGGPDEAALDRALTGVPAPARAAFVLRRLEGMDDKETLALLAAAGATDPATALSASYALEEAAPTEATASSDGHEHPWAAGAFDACSLRTRPTDLRRRRRRFRLALLLGAAATAGAVVLGVTGPGGSDPSPTLRGVVAAPDELARTPRDAWADTARVDFTAWPARGARTGDKDLLTRALAAWEDPPRDVRVTAADGTGTDPVRAGVRLLYAGDVGQRAVVLLHAPERLIRYSEPRSPGGARTLGFTRVDDADVTTAAAVAMGREDGRVWYLTAPWIAEARTRDLLRPDTPARPLTRTREGLTSPVPTPAARSGGACDTWPALQLRSSARIVEKHAFLVTDLGGAAPAHLSYTPLPGEGAPPRQPREATGPEALRAWARTACGLPELHAQDVRAVNVWDFAEQRLPENGGDAVWSCTRATTWRGPGEIQVRLRQPVGNTRLVAGDRSTAACGRFGQHLVAGTVWKSGSGHRYVLAAGSRDVTDLALRGGPETTTHGRTLHKRLRTTDAHPHLTGELRDTNTRATLCVSWTRHCR
ncbi:hypothetical protein [Streptomyces sp. NPDC048172]|uniref:hypothetical protein n=1 Tax=Streptomyces sp. NPDC048172 TaxID=3365505 RepID=UPI003718798A